MGTRSAVRDAKDSCLSSVTNDWPAVTANTNYPFNPTIKYVVTASASFNFFIRIPGWAVLKDSSISTSGSQSLPLTPDSSSLQKVAIFPGQTFITITFGQKVDVVNRENDAVAIHRGPLLYALDLDYTIESFPSLGYWSKSTLPESQVCVLAISIEYRLTTHRQLYPPYTEDHFLYPKSAWNIAIDPRTIVANDSASNTDTPLPNPVFAKGAPPLWIEVDACEVEWGVENDLLAPPPRRPKCMGAVGRVRFSPYGSTKVRMTELPVMAGKGLEGGGEL